MSPVLGFSLVLLLGMAAQWLAWRVRLPSILLLLLFGFAAGPGRLGLVDPQRLLGSLLLPIVALSAALILFEGGLSLTFREVREHGRLVLRLVTVGLLVTWALATALAHLLVGLPWGASLLLGAILTVSGPTVVVPLLTHIRPRGPTGPILKWEGIVIDPIGATLAVLVFEALVVGEARAAAGHALRGVVLTAVAGGTVGLAAAGLLLFLLRRYWIPDSLHNPAAFTLVVGAFAAANQVVPDSGLLAVTLMGVAMANRAEVPVRHIVEFKENLRVLLISGVFVLLAAALSLEDVARLHAGALLFVASLVLVVRPLSVLACTAGSSLAWRDRLFLMWMFPRGIVAAAVASVFALEMQRAGMAGAEDLVPLVFLVIVGTVVVYGLTAEPLARRLGLSTANPQGVLVVGAHALARDMAAVLQAERILVRLVDTNPHNLAAARMQGLPTWYGSALAEHAIDEIDLTGLGRLLALTPNEEVNTLAALHYVPVFGREKVYQLAPERHEAARGGATPVAFHGRILFAPDADYFALEERVERGARVKATRLTEKFSYEDFLRHNGPSVLPLFVVAGSTLTVGTVDKPLRPGPGQTVVALVEEGASEG